MRIDSVLQGYGFSLVLTSSSKWRAVRHALAAVALQLLVLAIVWGFVKGGSRTSVVASRRTCLLQEAAIASSFVQHQTLNTRKKVLPHLQEAGEELPSIQTPANGSREESAPPVDNANVTGFQAEVRAADPPKEVGAWRRWMSHQNLSLLQRLAHRTGLSGKSVLLWIAVVLVVLISLIMALAAGRLATESVADRNSIQSRRNWSMRQETPKSIYDVPGQPSNGSAQARERPMATPRSTGRLASSIGQLQSGGLASSIPPMSTPEVQQQRGRQFDPRPLPTRTSDVLCPDLVVPAGNECSLLLPAMPMKYNCTIDDVSFEPIFCIQGQGGALVLSSVGQREAKVFGRCCEFGENGELQICTATNSIFGWLCPAPNMKRASERVYQVMTQHGQVALTIRGSLHWMEITVFNNLGDIVGLVNPGAGDATPRKEEGSGSVRAARRNLLVGPGHDVGLIVLAIMGTEWLEARLQSSPQRRSSFDRLQRGTGVGRSESLTAL
mmetsp:Transcript_29039/g.66777  ORF Transcript_29039/g.66777 Transcript_29039/m.66777 type:complete len:497 (+) Transcript_29039:100-1590(+)